MTPARPVQKTRVTRSLQPGQPGTIRLRRLHGAALVCVRYRQNGPGTVRYTTVELIVDTRSVHRLPQAEAVVRFSLNESDKELRKKLMSQGARWDGVSKTWIMSLAVARALKLLPRR